MTTDLTRILADIEKGDPSAAEHLLPIVYDELRNLAAAKLASEAAGQTLQATAPVHEAYLRLVDVDKVQHWNSRGHFFGAAAEAMRRILVEQARRKKRIRHAGGLQREPVPDIAAPSSLDPDAILAVHEALTELTAEDASAANIVKLHFFAGLTLEETAEALGVSRATVYREWSYARAYLRLRLKNLQNS